MQVLFSSRKIGRARSATTGFKANLIFWFCYSLHCLGGHNLHAVVAAVAVVATVTAVVVDDDNRLERCFHLCLLCFAPPKNLPTSTYGFKMNRKKENLYSEHLTTQKTREKRTGKKWKFLLFAFTFLFYSWWCRRNKRRLFYVVIQERKRVEFGGIWVKTAAVYNEQRLLHEYKHAFDAL